MGKATKYYEAINMNNSNPFDILPGFKTYFSAVGLIGLAVYQFSQNDYASALQSLLAGIAAFGVRSALARHEALLREQERRFYE
jgi:hypothetical protein